MSLSDLTDILEGTLTPSEIVEELMSLSRYDIEDYAVKNKICPVCNSELVTRSWREPSEHFGYPSYENMQSLECERCRWTLD